MKEKKIQHRSHFKFNSKAYAVKVALSICEMYKENRTEKMLKINVLCFKNGNFNILLSVKVFIFLAN